MEIENNYIEAMKNLNNFENLVDVLQFRASSAASCNTAFMHIESSNEENKEISFASLDTEARAVAALIQRYAQKGDRVLLVYPPGIDYITTFFGCAYAGVIAVPALPPANRKTFPRLQGIIEDSKPVLVLTLSKFGDRMKEIKAEESTSHSGFEIVLSDITDKSAEDWKRPMMLSDDIVFLQYTSGSTGQPKGVMVTHGNILANLTFLSRVFPLEANETIVSWLPPHHDMGLISKILYPVFVGARCVQFAPVGFLMRPYRWLQAISEHKARFTAAPNFAFALCINRITDQEKASLDLSCVRYALNGAEPIRPATLREFSAAFENCGWQAEMMVPGYGLAESTLLVSAHSVHLGNVTTADLSISKAALAVNLVRQPADLNDRLEIVPVGFTEPSLHEIVIVDPVSRQRCAGDEIGEIWVRGPSVAKGYWNRAKLTEDIFQADFAGALNKYLRTGDLGFMREGELYVTGRLKEMMIFEGNNIYPQDVERTIEKLWPSFRPNGCAVFSLEENFSTKLVVVQEVESRSAKEFHGIEDAISEMVLEQHGIMAISAVLLVKPGHAPRTSSGKIQRLLCRELFLQKKFETIWEWRSSAVDADISVVTAQVPVPSHLSLADFELYVKNAASKVLGFGIEDSAKNLFAAGMSSIDALRITNEIRRIVNAPIRTSDLFKNPSIAGMADILYKRFYFLEGESADVAELMEGGTV